VPGSATERCERDSLRLVPGVSKSNEIRKRTHPAPAFTDATICRCNYLQIDKAADSEHNFSARFGRPDALRVARNLIFRSGFLLRIPIRGTSQPEGDDRIILLTATSTQIFFDCTATLPCVAKTYKGRSHKCPPPKN
jgi:hypothetical protein